MLTESNILQNKDTQTSASSKFPATTTKSTTRIGENRNRIDNKTKSEVSSINYTRGSQSNSLIFDNDILERSLLKVQSGNSRSRTSTDCDIAQITSSKSFLENNIKNLANFENLPANHFSGFSLNMVSMRLL